MSVQLAQINIAKLLAPLTDPALAGFVDRLDEINRLAEVSPGFIWRLIDDDAQTTSLDVFQNADTIINMSVWSSIQSLKAYVYDSIHVELMKQRRSWFVPLASDSLWASQAMWWVPEGHVPDPHEARRRLERIKQHGPGPFAFDFANPWPAPFEYHRPSDARLSAATIDDGPQIRALLGGNHLPIDDIDDSAWRSGAYTWFLVARQRGQIVAAAGLEPCGEDALLRSLVVNERERGASTGRALVSELKAIAQARGTRSMYLLTETATEYFAKQGFTNILRDRVSARVARTAQFYDLCPDSAQAMVWPAPPDRDS